MKKLEERCNGIKDVVEISRMIDVGELRQIGIEISSSDLQRVESKAFAARMMGKR